MTAGRKDVPESFSWWHSRLMAANYNRPKPIDPIAYRRGCYLNIRCKCGHAVSVQLGKFAQDNGIPERTQAYQLIKRLRCSRSEERRVGKGVCQYVYISVVAVSLKKKKTHNRNKP